MALRADHVEAYLLASFFFFGVPALARNLPPEAKLSASALAVVCALEARKNHKLLSLLEEEAQRTKDMDKDYRQRAQALEHALRVASLEDSYGLYSEPEPTPKQVPPAKEKPVYESQFDFRAEGEDFVFLATAPDAKAEVLDWLTPEFAVKSKVVVAGSGSGKSSYLRWEYRVSSRSQKTYLFDPHLRANHLDQEGPMWLSTIDQDLRCVCHTAHQMSEVLRGLTEEIEERLTGNRPLEPIHIIIDEADARLFSEDTTLKDLLAKFVTFIANEARKTKVTLTLVTHTMKKEKTGFDSADLEQITWLMLGNILGAANIKWPSNLDTKSWDSRQKQLQATMNPDLARVAVLRNQDGVVSLEVIPKEAFSNG